MDDRLTKATEFAREQLAGAEDDPGMSMSPDGYGERDERAAVLRELLAILEPDAWCPPHHYRGQAMMVRGEAILTCEICGDQFTGTWKHDRATERPPAAGTPCPTCGGGGWKGGVPWKRPDENSRLGRLCKTCGGSGTSPPDEAKAQEVRERHEASLVRAREMGFVTA